MGIGDQISQLIEQQGIEKTKLCTYLGINRGTLDNWIKGKSFPDTEEVKRMSSFFNISISSLYGETPDYKEKLIETQESTIEILREEVKKLWEHVDQLVTKIPDAK